MNILCVLLMLGCPESLKIAPNSAPVVQEVQSIVLPVPPVVEASSSPVVDEPATTTIAKEVKCQCVAFARTLIPSIPYPTNADELKPNGTPDLGAGIIFHYGRVAHIAVIQGFTNEGWRVIEANKTPCEITNRIVRYDDPFIFGFYNGKI